MLSPLLCLLLGIVLILLFILYFRFHAFLALISSALIIAFLSDSDKLGPTNAISQVTTSFGNTMANIGILLVFAALIGKCLMDSGAADRIVRSFSRLFGVGREQYSLLSSGFILSIPVFFDTVFYLLAPLCRAVYARRKKDYVLLICMAGAGAAVTHALVPPTPGPIIVAEQLGVSIGMTLFLGILASIVPVLVGGLWYSNFINKRMTVEPTDMMGVTQQELEVIVNKPDSELPSLFFSLLPIAVPIFLVSLLTILDVLLNSNWIEYLEEVVQNETLLYLIEFIKNIVQNDTLLYWTEIIGDKTISFFFGAILAVWLVISAKKISFQEAFQGLEPAIISGAMIAFITCAGGAFGAILNAANVGDVVAEFAKNFNISILLLSFLLAALIRVAQGSATVAMITTAGIIAPTIVNLELAYNPAYLVAAIGFGATTTSWMNDSGFWIVGKMAGFTEKETLKTWTVLLTILAFTGIAWVYILTIILPMK